MSRIRIARRVAVALALCFTGVAATAGSALAYSFSIDVSGPSSGSVGRAVALEVRGKNPAPAEYWFNSYYSVEAVPAHVVSACPGGHAEASQMAVETVPQGGTHVTPIWVRENPNAAGDWSSALAYTPRVPGRMLLCAYTNDGFTNTLARAQTAIEVRSARAPARKRCKKAARKTAIVAAKKCKRRR
jgi:hypothetical protein